jgi:hypothetical protein
LKEVFNINLDAAIVIAQATAYDIQQLITALSQTFQATTTEIIAKLGSG